MPARPQILIVRFGSLGDVVLTTPLVRAIRRRHPDAAITYVTKSAYAPVLANHPHLDAVRALAPGNSVVELARSLRGVRWAHRLDLHGSLRSFAVRAILGGRWRTYPKRRFRRSLLVRFGVDRYGPPVSVAERYFDAAGDLNVRPDGLPPEVFTSATDDERARAVCDGAYVALAPGAAHATKRWPAIHWVALAKALDDDGIRVLGLGLEEERGYLRGAPIVDGFGVGLGPTAALLRGARAVVANDSGLMHLATAVGTPVVALFGPTVRAFGFFPSTKDAVVLEQSLSCRPCSPYGGPHCPLGHHRCMFDIRPEAVARAVRAA
jgi:ADP-heptose:LPS heptosyltransferase